MAETRLEAGQTWARLVAEFVHAHRWKVARRFELVKEKKKARKALVALRALGSAGVA